MVTSTCTWMQARSNTEYKKQRFKVNSVALPDILIASQRGQTNLPRDLISSSKIFLIQTTAY